MWYKYIVPDPQKGMEMLNQQQRASLFEAFKQILKERRISYKKLAQKTHMAESTLKRIFSIEECSLAKFIQLAEAVDLTLHDLVIYAEGLDAATSIFSLEAEKFLSENLEYFFFYRKLVHHKSVHSLMKEESISKRQSTEYLKKLDQLKIIEWLPNDKIKFCHPGFLKFREDGPLRDAVYRAWVPKFHRKVISNTKQKDHLIKVFSTRASKEAKEDFFLRYNELVGTFLKRASLETKTMPQNVSPIGVTLMSGPYRVGLDERLSSLI